MATDLTYSVARELLVGTVAGQTFAIPASSGGGRGSVKSSVPQVTPASYSPYRKMDATRGIRGGAIPPGVWKVLPPREHGDSKGPWVSVLMPDETTRKAYPQRDYETERFKIHGTGPKGSDGCLVIALVHRIPLLKAIKQAGGATLTVLWEGDRMNQRIELSKMLDHYA